MLVAGAPSRIEFTEDRAALLNIRAHDERDLTMAKHSTHERPRRNRGEPSSREKDDPPIRLAHVLFVLWVTGSVAWAFFAAALAHQQGWWEHKPMLGAILVLAPPILAHVLANTVIRTTGNPRFRS
jgi:hypothetical protein